MIKKIAKFFTKTELQQTMEKSCLSKDNFIFKQEDVNQIFQFMIEEQNVIDFFDFYLKEEMHTYTIKMKMLITIHQILNISEEFARGFAKTKFNQFSRLKHCNRNNEFWLLMNVQIPFLFYLQKLAFNISDIKSYRTCLFRKQIISSNLAVESYRLLNIVNQALSLVPNIKIALTNYPYDFLLKRVACIIYLEIHSFQRQLINSLSALVNENCQAKKVEIFEFLRELQIIESKMMRFYSLNKLFDPSGTLSQPLKLKIDMESVQHLEQSAWYEIEKNRLIRSLKTSRDCSQASDSPIKKRVIFSAANRASREFKFEEYNSGKCQQTIKEVVEIEVLQSQQ